jgi:hypothetical protein
MKKIKPRPIRSGLFFLAMQFDLPAFMKYYSYQYESLLLIDKIDYPGIELLCFHQIPIP